LAEKYLHLFDLPTPPDGWPDCLLFHPALNYPGKGKMPALVARVDDVSGQMTGIWREFIRADGRKADVEFQKLGLGPVAGGAVRLGGMGERIGCAEGVRTALGAWSLIGFKYPVWSCLSTAGLIGFEVPLGVERIVIYPDSDRPIKKQGHEFVAATPAGRKAAEAMRARVVQEGVAVVIAAEPAIGADYLNVWQAHAREVA
jgi:putative DNA primase/helicase